MTVHETRRGLTRRQLLSRSVAAGAAFAVGPGFLAAADAAWATETAALKPETMATLVQMARDIYPHDRIPTEFYVIAVKGYDTPRPPPASRRASPRSTPPPRARASRTTSAPDGNATVSTSCAGWRRAPSSSRSAGAW